MDYFLTEDQRDLMTGLEKTLEPFDDAYWLDHDQSGAFPEEFYQAMAQGGWLGIATPEDMGGGGLGVLRREGGVQGLKHVGDVDVGASVEHIFLPEML